MGNTFKAMVVGGKQKKDPSKTWQALVVEATVDGVLYKSGLIFPKREERTIPNDKLVKF